MSDRIQNDQSNVDKADAFLNSDGPDDEELHLEGLRKKQQQRRALFLWLTMCW